MGTVWTYVKGRFSFEWFFLCHRQYSVDYKLETYLKIARLYLENDDPVQAEAYINRASLLQVITTFFLQNHVKVFILYIHLVIKYLCCTLIFRLNPKTNSCKYITKCVMPEYWIIVVSLLKLHSATMNCHTGGSFMKTKGWQHYGTL